MWQEGEIESLSRRFGIRVGVRLHEKAEDFHFPEGSFLSKGYSPPGGYVKDFSVVRKDGRLHLFHIDGRPGEVCGATGNEISFGHASTADYRRWIRHPMPLAVGERAYAMSDDPLHYEPDSIREFSFAANSPEATPNPALGGDRPTPLSIELVAPGKDIWLVAYFRWHVDRNRLFFGTLDWSADPAAITEIDTDEHLAEVLRHVGL